MDKKKPLLAISVTTDRSHAKANVSEEHHAIGVAVSKKLFFGGLSSLFTFNSQYSITILPCTVRFKFLDFKQKFYSPEILCYAHFPTFPSFCSLLELVFHTRVI
jgi:hypothetical protein